MQKQPLIYNTAQKCITKVGYVEDDFIPSLTLGLDFKIMNDFINF